MAGRGYVPLVAALAVLACFDGVAPPVAASNATATGNATSAAAATTTGMPGGANGTTMAALTTTMAPTGGATSGPNGTSIPTLTPSPTTAGFAVGVRLFTLGFRIAGDHFAAALAAARADLTSAVAVDLATNLATRTQLVAVRRLDVGSLVVEADVHADGSAGAASPADQRDALDARYLASAHDFISVRLVYFAVNGDTGEALQTRSINMTNRDDTFGGSVTPPPPGPPARDRGFGAEDCGVACGAFVAGVLLFGAAIAAVVAYLCCCRRDPQAASEPTTKKAPPGAKPSSTGMHAPATGAAQSGDKPTGAASEPYP
uniref:Uncharacterized protein n=1 Tax=Neobodo designis TaxID=312471 RepID=A0A7S1Q619_NEODS